MNKKPIPSLLEMETVIARKWGTRKNIIVPNISWGFNIHECDLLIISQSLYAIEVEIKRSKADLKKDIEKRHAHKSDRIQYLYFAIPEAIENCIDLIPEHAGIVIIRSRTISEYYSTPYHYADIIRHPKKNVMARKLTLEEAFNVSRLGCMRIWNLKSTVIGHINDRKSLLNIEQKQQRSVATEDQSSNAA